MAIIPLLLGAAFGVGGTLAYQSAKGGYRGRRIAKRMAKAVGRLEELQAKGRTSSAAFEGRHPRSMRGKFVPKASGR